MEEVAKVLNAQLREALTDFMYVCTRSEDWLYARHFEASQAYWREFEEARKQLERGEEPLNRMTLSACCNAARALTMHELRFRKGAFAVDLAKLEEQVEFLRASEQPHTQETHCDIVLASACLQALYDHADHVLIKGVTGDGALPPVPRLLCE